MTELDCFERQTVSRPWAEQEVADLMRMRVQEGRDWSYIAVALGRTESGVKSKYKYEQFQREVRAPSVPFVREPVPDGVLKEQARRVVAWGERSLTASLMGDPAPQFSALGQRVRASHSPRT